MRRPPGWAVMVSIFCRPRAAAGSSARLFVPELPSKMWDTPSPSSRPSDVPDPAVETTLARALLHYLRDEFDEALEMLDRLDAAVASGTIPPMLVGRCRGEVLLVAGRARASAGCLQAAESTLSRCWLARAYVESGEVAAADEVFAKLDEGASRDELNLLQYAWHSAFAGDFERCERLFEQLLRDRTLVRHTPYEHWRGYALTATGLAADGVGAERAAGWTAGLLDRLKSKATAG